MFHWESALVLGMVLLAMEIIWNFPWAKRLAIHITPTTFRGPLLVGRDEPILFEQIDYEKTLHRRRFG
jgi:hypothetical protein